MAGSTPYPLSLHLTGRAAVVVGGGPVAARRAAGLVEAGAQVLMVAPDLCEEALQAVASGQARWLARPYTVDDLDGAWLVHTATGDRDVDDRVAADAEARRIWCVRADDASRSAAWTPAVARTGDVTVAVTTDGDPRRAARLKQAVLTALDTGQLPLRRHRPGSRGRVDLVGGGPGDPGLISVRGRRLLAEADVVVVDRLAPLSLLADLDPEVEIIDVGKTPQHHPVPQQRINELLVEHALAGKRVVRLKGGDPYVLGRGGEEVLACRAAGVDVSVVPGVTSAIAVPAAFGIPVTHRTHARGFTVVSGHEALQPGAVPPEGTIVLLMAVSALAGTAAAIVAAGRSPDTPVAVLEDGFGARARRTSGTLSTIAERAEAAGVRAPAVVVVGEVAALADDLAPGVDRQQPDPVVLVAHGSRNPDSGAINHAIARRMRERLVGTEVVVAQLDHDGPRPHEAIDALAAAGHRTVRVQPLLFTPAYHVTVDLPEVLDRSAAVTAGTVRAQVQAPLVSHPRLLDALDHRLAEVTDPAGPPVAFDALVMSSAGTSNAAAQDALRSLAARWGARHGVPAVAAFASAADPSPRAAVTNLVRGGHRVAVGSLFFGPGYLPDRARSQAVEAGAVAVARHIGDLDELIDILEDRYRRGCPLGAGCRTPRCDFGPDCPAV